MKSRRILIVEDEMVVQLHLTRIVEELGHDVVGTAADRDEALELASSEKPELVLMDIHLASGSDGVETASSLVAEHGCAVIFISAYADQATVERTEQVGAAGYLVKPFTQAQVRAAIATAFASHARLVQERQRSHSLQAMLERIGGAVFLLDATDRITFANQSAAELVGWPVYRTYGRSLGEVFGAAGQSSPLAEALGSVRSGSQRGSATIELFDKDGKPRMVEIAMEPVRTDQDGAEGVLLTLRQRAAQIDRNLPATVKKAFGKGTRLLVYSHDTFGLGHLRRCMALIKAVCARHPEASVLLVTGSPMVHRYGMPTGSDYVKLPALVKVEAEQYEARSLQISGDAIRSLRSNLILHTVKDYRPNALLVDHSPTGSRGELLPALDWLRQNGGCQRILGMRDILDDPKSVMETWKRTGVYEALEANYDHVVVYGNQEVYDPVREYQLPASLASRAKFMNYVCTPDDGLKDAPSSSGKPTVLVTIGGGDGGADTVILPFLKMLRARRADIDFHAEILTGPFVDPELEQRIREESEDLPCTIRGFVPSTAALIRSSELVIATGGYNTCTDILSLARRAIVIPRVLYRQEQWIRASRFQELGFVTCMHPDSVNPDSLFTAIQSARKDETLTRLRQKGLPIDGAPRFAEFCASLMVDADV